MSRWPARNTVVPALAVGALLLLAAGPASAATAPQFTEANPPLTVSVDTGPFGGYVFAASGDPAPTFSIASGALPAGVTLDATSGRLTGTGTPGDFTFSVRASNGVGPDAIAGPFTGHLYASYTEWPACVNGQHQVVAGTIVTSSSESRTDDVQQADPDVSAAATDVVGRAGGATVFERRVDGPADGAAAKQVFTDAAAAVFAAAPGSTAASPQLLSQTVERSQPVETSITQATAEPSVTVTPYIGPRTISVGTNLDCTEFLTTGAYVVDTKTTTVTTRTHHLQLTATTVSTYAVDGKPAAAASPTRGAGVSPTLTAGQLAPLLGLPPAKACVSKRRFTVHPRVHVSLAGSAATVTSVSLKLGSKTIVKNAKPKAADVDLRGVRKGTFTLTITAKTSDRRTLTGKATYHTCAAKKKK